MTGRDAQGGTRTGAPRIFKISLLAAEDSGMVAADTRKRRGSGQRASRGAADGFTLIEMLVAISIGGVLLTLSVAGMLAMARSQQQSSTANGVLTTLRSAEAKSLAEGRTYCVRFDSATAWTLWRYSCDPADSTPGVLQETAAAQGTAVVGTVALTANAATGVAHSCPSPARGCAFFYPRGIASSGTVRITRPGSSSTYTATVVGITGRVFLTH